MKNKKKGAVKSQTKTSKPASTVSVSAGRSSSGSGKIQPLGDRVLIKPILASEAEKKNDFGILIPDTVSKEMPEQGRVLAVGEGRFQDGKVIPLKVKVGDKVIFSKYGFDEVKVDADELYILREESILAIIK